MQALRIHVNDSIFVSDFVAKIVYVIKEFFQKVVKDKKQPKQSITEKRAGSRSPPPLNVKVREVIKTKDIFGGGK